MFQIPLEFLGILLAAFIIYSFTMFRIMRSKPKKAENRVNPPAPKQLEPYSFPLEQERTPIPVTIVSGGEPEKVEHEKLDMLLAEVVRQNINRLDVAPQITLTNKGEYRILGKTWSGEVNITIKPKQTEKAEEKAAEKTEEERGEPVF
jgi:hypothetical protein